MKTVLIFVPNYFPGYMSGGIARTVLNTVEWLGEEISFLIVTRDRDLGDKAPYPNIERGVWVQMSQSKVRYLAPDELSLSRLATLIRDTPHDILHLNSFFDPVFTIKLLLLIRLKRIHPRQVVLSPRGEFVAGPLKLKYPKKRLYIELSKLAGFYRDLRWHASSPHEAEGIAKAMRMSSDRVRSAIDLPIKDGAVVLDHQPSGDRLRVVFLSRLTREKNLDGALRILQSVRQPMDFDIIGPEEDPVYWQECTALIKKLPPHVCARYLGPLAPEQVFHHLSQYDVFLFPSHGENYGHVIAESISVGTRVLISRATPWRNLEQDGVGWDIDLTQVDKFAAVLDQLANQTPSERAAARPRVRAAAATRLFDPVALENNRLLYSNSWSSPMTAVSNPNYRICSNCIMDTSDAGITFDARGWCDYCNNYHDNILPNWHTDERGQAEIEGMVAKIKKDGEGREYDSLLGISGGVDSSYLAYLAKEKFGLRPLVFHVDAGWNSQQAVHNIECIVEGLGLHLHTEVINWQEMKDLQLAYFKAQVPHLDTPQDHAFFASLYNFAAKYKIKYILNGGNYSTECVREPLEWAYHASDLRQLKDIHSKYGTRPLKSFPLSDIFTYKLYYRYVKGVEVLRPLNSVPYIKEDAMRLLIDKFGWQKYAHKHYESRFTRFYEGYWQPTKFGYDKRRAHFSSVVLTNQMTRDEALEKIAQTAYDPATVEQDFEYIATKLDISVEELRALHNGPNKSWRDYKSRQPLIDLGTRILRAMGVQRAIIR